MYMRYIACKLYVYAYDIYIYINIQNIYYTQDSIVLYLAATTLCAFYAPSGGDRRPPPETPFGCDSPSNIPHAARERRRALLPRNSRIYSTLY